MQDFTNGLIVFLQGFANGLIVSIKRDNSKQEYLYIQIHSKERSEVLLLILLSYV